MENYFSLIFIPDRVCIAFIHLEPIPENFCMKRSSGKINKLIDMSPDIIHPWLQGEGKVEKYQGELKRQLQQQVAFAGPF